MNPPLSALQTQPNAATPPVVLRKIQASLQREAMPTAPIYKSAGEIVGRRDLPDEVVLQAVAERLRFEKRDPRQARVVLDAALAGKQIAVNFVRSLALPMPAAPLEMPVQPLLADEMGGGSKRPRRFAFLSW